MPVIITITSEPVKFGVENTIYNYSSYDRINHDIIDNI